jgi:hypothetical protein
MRPAQMEHPGRVLGRLGHPIRTRRVCRHHRERPGVHAAARHLAGARTRQLAAPGLAPGAGDSLVVERVSVMDAVPATVLRLTWRSSGLEAAQVSLLLADSAQAVLASQTLRAPPFTALLDPPAGTAYAGVTAVWPGHWLERTSTAASASIAS